MKLSYNWLKEFIKLKFSPQELAEKLTLAGFEVEKIFYLGKGLEKIVAGEIKEIKKHPNADKLFVSKINIGEKNVQIIFGTVFEVKIGQKVPIALAPLKLPTGIEIKKTKIRGIESEGMICSDKELGLELSKIGLTFFSKEIKNGTLINEVLKLDDPVFDLEITPNRGDCLSVLGLARETAAITGFSFCRGIASSSPTITSGTPRNDSLEVEVKEPALCPKYTARIIKNIKVEESPGWLKARLRACGIRSVNNIVDITNYVMMEIGQPLHAFDYEKLEVRSQKSKVRGQKSDVRCQMSDKEIIVRRVKYGEKIVTIDGKERELDETMLVIADSKRPIAIAGIMGGKDSEVTPKTTDIILESAQFDPVSIRKTARKLGLQSESSYRFERGVDWNGIEAALDRATQLIAQLANNNQKTIKSKIKSQKLKVGVKNLKLEIGEIVKVTQQKRYLRRVIKLPVEKVSEILGVKISKKKIKDILESLGFKIAESSLSLRGSPDVLVGTTEAIPWLRKKLVKEARKLLGRPYKYGAKESEAPKKFDCSSFVQYLYKKIGIIIPRCSIDQAEIGDHTNTSRIFANKKRINIGTLKRKLKPGDLVFGKGEDKEPLPHYSANYPDGLGHVGIYVGAGKVIHVDRERKEVIEESLEEFIRRKEWRGARRILSVAAGSVAAGFSLRSWLWKRTLKGAATALDELIVTVPSWREDISIPEDLIEELGRVYDYNKLKPTALRGETPSPKINKELYWENLIKDTLAAASMTEVYNYSFYSRISTNDLRISTNSKEECLKKHLRVINPINPDQEFLRTSLIPQLLQAIEKNAKNFDEIKIFELGKVYLANFHKFTTNTNFHKFTTDVTNELPAASPPALAGGRLPDERKMVAGIINSNVKTQISKPQLKSQNYINEPFYQIKDLIELLFNKLGISIDRISYRLLADIKTDPTLQITYYKLQEERSATVIIDKKVIGIIGETDSNVGLFELDFQKLIKYSQEEKKFQTISSYPAVERDLAIVLDKNIPYINLEKTIKDIDPLIKEIELFDIFESEKKIGKNKKSLAFHLKFQTFDRTLRKEEVDNIFQNILEKIEKDFGAKIRE